MQNMQSVVLAIIMITGVTLLNTGCTDVTVRPGLPDYMTNIAVPTFQNRTQQPNLENELTQQVVQEFLIDGRMTLVDSDEATSILQGTIVRYQLEPLLLDVHNTPEQYKMRIMCRLALKDTKAGQDIWTEDDFEESTTYYVANTRGIPPEDEQLARKRLIEQLAKSILKRVVEGF
jgi:hypothetical protein